MSQAQHATLEGTAAYRDRFKGQVDDAHFRLAEGLWMSSIGIGTYLGDPDERTDANYRVAVTRALELGCNVIDSAANYRFQRSERNIGDALTTIFAEGKLSRDEIVITTKGGYIPFNNSMPITQREFYEYIEETFLKPGVCKLEDFVQGSHCMTPGYLKHQLNQSLANLKLDYVDVYYIHNPESQFAEVAREDFYKRLRDSFEFLESAVADGKIQMYGTATWNGYRVRQQSPEYLSLEKVVETAREVAGDKHHFKVVQLPVNLAMTEAFKLANQTIGDRTMTFLEAARELGIIVMASSSMLQARLSAKLPSEISDHLRGLHSDAQRAIQFARSTPNVTTALVGMSRIQHVEENLALAKFPPTPSDEFLKLFGE
ncbi:MAG TPA: aldo/keto reductase [Blastocatellia bacterium]|nr:aldo/keto reductase [Blastocatellia bacterium]